LLFITFFLMFILSFGLVGTVYYFGIMSAQKANEAILAKQASHTKPTSRLGGIACIIASLILIFFIADKTILFLILSALPVFIAGGLEDLGYNIKPTLRLFAAMISGAVAIYLTGVWLDNVDLTILTPILTFPPIAISFTIFSSAGVSNSINLIDGVNGLASGIIAIMTGALCFMCLYFGETQLATVCIILLGSILGFFVWNFPNGLIFLGDAGAYTFGHILTWISILLISKHPEISAWAIFCIFFWPIADTVSAIYRRQIKRISINQPDRMHFHQLVMRVLVIRSDGRIPSNLANPLATIIILPFCAVVAFLGTIFLDNNFYSILVIIFATLIFHGSYNLIIHTARSKIFKRRIRPK